MVKDLESCLNMTNTIKFYETLDQEKIPNFGQCKFPIQVEHQEHIPLSIEEMGGIYNSFPENSRDRSYLIKIIGKPKTWFHEDEYIKNDKLEPTTDLEDSLFDGMGFIPGYISNENWPNRDIHLYDLLENIAEPIRKIITTQALIHEIGHSLFDQLYHFEEVKLDYNNEEKTGWDLFSEFKELTKNLPAISDYSLFYRNTDNGEYSSDTGIKEEFCESLAAYKLGFVYSSDEKRQLDPFYDRPEVEEFIKNFLDAKKLGQDKVYEE